jgi:L-2-hydroxyglutarate oxidase
MFDVAVIGGGIVGMATALALTANGEGGRVVVLEKEDRVGAHQTGHNSGVMHSGVYYRPGSLKAQLCREGNRALVRMCVEHGIPHHVCGKVIVATDDDELPRLDELAERAAANGIPAERLGPAGVRDHEPHVRGVGGLWLRSTGIVDFQAVTRVMADLVTGRGGDVRLGAEVTAIDTRVDGHDLATPGGVVRARFLVNCAGLQSDRVAERAGASLSARIVPFRGEYYELVPERRELVRGLVYPVPDPQFPFLGVHFTRMIDGGVHAGPNAVLALRREGYRKRDVSARDTWDTLSFPGFWRLARHHVRTGAAEVARSFSKRLFVRGLRRLVPEVGVADLVPTTAGVRAQALERDGRLVEDFLLVRSDRAIHVCNAPSPAATSALAIGRVVATEVLAEVR